MYHHRPTKLKQENKTHKTGSHSTKRAITATHHGRVETTPGAAGSGKPAPRKGVKKVDA
jgi:hypothetical protein